MPLAFTHLTIGWAVGVLFQYVTGIALAPAVFGLFVFSSILPDSDFLLEWLLKKPVHRTFTHSVLGILLFGAIGALICSFGGLQFLGLESSAAVFLAITLGMLCHVVPDLFEPLGVQLFYPLPISVSFHGFTRWKRGAASLSVSQRQFLIDMAVGVLWLFVLWVTGRVVF